MLSQTTLANQVTAFLDVCFTVFSENLQNIGNMSIYYRKEYYHEKLFLKSLHLKSCKKKLLEILPDAYSEDDFVDVFQACFPHVWEDIESFCNLREDDFLRRKGKGFRTLLFYTPRQYLLKHCSFRRTEVSPLSEQEKLKRKELMIASGRKKLQARRDKLAANMVYVQKVCPSYVSKLIQAYFDTRRKKTLDVNARYLILFEASQFKCKQTLNFLHKINACEKNQYLRKMAFYALQQMGEHPWLARGRKGKKSLSQLKEVDIVKTPTALLELMRDYQNLLYQKYDVFLSHSCLDEEELLKLKSILNSQGYTVYIDWINDREMLNRENKDENTWNVLYKRMDQADRMIYVMTDRSIESKSTEKEVLYFKKARKQVYVYQPDEIIKQRPEYLDGCVDVKLINMISFDR